MAEILRADYRSIKPACDALLAGKMIAFPTETVYGLGVLTDKPAAAEDMRRLKGREQDKPFQILIPSIRYAYRYATWDNPGAEALMRTFWPGPLTLILPGIDGTGATSGLRIPADKWIRVLMLELKCGLFATSANHSGDKPATSAASISKNISDNIGLIIENGNSEIGEGSTVAGISDSGELEIFRHGAITEAELQAVYQQNRQ